MSWFTSLRDSVENGVGTAMSPLGLNITPVLSVAAGGDPNLPAISLAGSAAPSGRVGVGGVPNKNAGIFAGFSTLSTQAILLLVGAFVLLYMFVRRG